MKDLTSEQTLLYTGAVGAAACGVASLIDNGRLIEQIYSKDTPTTSNSVGRKMMHWHGVSMLTLSATQALAAHEKPSSKMVGLVGSAWVAAGAVQAIHTFHGKASSAEVGGALTAFNLAIGGACIARAIQMRKTEEDIKVVKK